MPSAETLLRTFLARDPRLWSLCLLHHPDRPGLERLDFEAMRSFLFWFVAEGRRRHQLDVVIPPELWELVVAGPDGNALMLYLGRETGRRGDPAALASWFHAEAVPFYRLASYLTDPDFRMLAPLARRYGEGELRERWLSGPPLARGERTAALVLAAALARENSGTIGSVPRVSIVGFHRAVLGIGEDARRLFDCLCGIGVLPELVDVARHGATTIDDADRYAPFEADRPSAPIVVFCLPAFEMMRAIARLNLSRPPVPHRWIGYWPWETTELHPAWRHAYDTVDEVWASSSFLGGVYAEQTSKPIVAMPLHVAIEKATRPTDLEALFAGRFSFLSVLDLHSRIERKNPLGAIQAFRQAFPGGLRHVQLVLKTLHGDEQPEALAALRRATGGDDRIVVVDGPLPADEVFGLISMADVYLSLHRAEGFGRPLVEAMLLGTPVLATQFSGSADIVGEATGFPVGSTLRPVRAQDYPFAAGLWAEPDLDEAARLMRRLHDDRALLRSKTEAARRHAQTRFGREAIEAQLRERIGAIAGRLSEEYRRGFSTAS